MRATIYFTACLGSVLAVQPSIAQDRAVIDGLPAGVLIMDADPAAPPVVIDAAPVDPITIDLNASVEIAVPEAVVVEDPLPIQTAPLTQTQSPASTRSPALMPLSVEASPSGAVVLDPARVAPQIDLAPGETIIEAIAVPSIVKVPDPQPVYTIQSQAAVPAQRAAPEPVVDPVTGRLRDTPGWTGRTDGPASIGCFPEGACAVLNTR